MSWEYYGEERENIRKGIERVRRSVRLHDSDDEPDDYKSQDGGPT